MVLDARTGHPLWTTGARSALATVACALLPRPMILSYLDDKIPTCRRSLKRLFQVASLPRAYRCESRASLPSKPQQHAKGRWR
jgi:hypothetical protein